MSVDDGEVRAEVKDVVEYMSELVAAVVPFCERKEQKENQMDTADTNAVAADSDSDVEIIEMDGKTKDAIEDITCEVSFDMDFKKCCAVCESESELPYQVYDHGKVELVCSQECMKQFREESTNICHLCKSPMTTDTQGYLSNFALQNCAFCSEQCLLQYEAENEPSSQCFECTSVVKKTNTDSVVFYWQTMNFCSIHCISKLQVLIGEKCCFCKKKVVEAALGKYSVRFGDVVRQFCDGICLDSYKKDLLLCGFCQKDLRSSDPLRVRTISSAKFKNREFCDNVCLTQFEKLIASKNAAKSNESASNSVSSLNVGCTQCQRIVLENDAMKISYENDDYYLCGSTCIAAFKYTHNINSVICESCYNFDWNTSKLTQLQYSGVIKLFCSKKCVNVFVLKKRKIVGCWNCKVKKYDFDMIERYECASNNSKMFCSSFCLKRFSVSNDSDNSHKEQTKYCSTCGKTSNIHVNIDGQTKYFCSSACMTKKHIQMAGILNSDDSAKNSSKTSGTSVVLQAQEQPPIGSKVHNSPPNSLRIVAPPSVSLSPATIASTMWTPFAPVQTTVSVTRPQNSLQVSNPCTSTLQSMLQSQQMNNVSVTLTPSPRVGTPITRPALIGQPQTTSAVRPNLSPILSQQLSLPVQTQTTSTASNSGVCVNSVSSTADNSVLKTPQKIVMCNKSVIHRPHTRNKATGCRPSKKTIAVGPDGPSFEQQKIIPVPIPIFIPCPVPLLRPLPFPLPVPFFFPSETIKNALNGTLSVDNAGNNLDTNFHSQENHHQIVPCVPTIASNDQFGPHKRMRSNRNDTFNSSAPVNSSDAFNTCNQTYSNEEFNNILPMGESNDTYDPNYSNPVKTHNHSYSNDSINSNVSSSASDTYNPNFSDHSLKTCTRSNTSNVSSNASTSRAQNSFVSRQSAKKSTSMFPSALAADKSVTETPPVKRKRGRPPKNRPNPQ